MGILDIFRLKSPESRAAGPGPFAALSLLGGAYSSIDPRLAEGLSAVTAAVERISGAIGALPLYLRVDDEKGEPVDGNHPVMRLVRHGPNARQSWSDFIEWLMSDTLLWGNGLAGVISDSRGRPVELVPLPWRFVSVKLLPSGRLAYDVTTTSLPFGAAGLPRRWLDSEVIHLKDRSDDGYIGRPRLARAAPVIAAALAQQVFAANLFEKGGIPSGIMKISQTFGQGVADRLRHEIDNLHAGASQAHKIMVLQEGMDYSPFNITAEDSQLLASRQFAVEEIARLFNVPPPLIADYSHNTFTNSASAGRWFAQFTLTPWLRKLEAELARALLTESERDLYELSFDLSSLLRGDDTARWQSYQIALQNGVLTPSEVRVLEGFAAMPQAAPSDPVDVIEPGDE